MALKRETPQNPEETPQAPKPQKAREKTPKVKRSRKRGKAPALIAGLVVGTAGFGALYVGLTAQQPETTEIFRTSKPLAANQLVTIDDLSTVNVPVEAAPDNRITRDELSANLYFAEVAIPAGTPLSDAVVSTDTRTNTPLPEGMVTASFEVDPSSAVGGKIQPGDYVNITAVGQGRDGEEVARTILQRVLVLDVSVDPATLAKSAGSGTVDAEELDGPNSPKIYGGVPNLYTVALTNEQAAVMALARDKDLYLTRTTFDATEEDVAVSESEVFGGGTSALPTASSAPSGSGAQPEGGLPSPSGG